MRNNRYFDYVPDATRQAGGIGVLRDDRFPYESNSVLLFNYNCIQFDCSLFSFYRLHPGHTAIDNLFANANQIIFDTNTNVCTCTIINNILTHVKDGDRGIHVHDVDGSISGPPCFSLHFPMFP